jgi:pyridoxamine 5'-phosphate oxidase
MQENFFIHTEGHPSNPFEMFKQWFDEAKKTTEIKDATALSLATSSKGGRPSVRMVLLKNFDDKGLTFFTNGDSQKGKNLEQNPQAEACFYWEPLGKQIRVYGKVEKVSEEESDEYFSSRHINSQMAACVSKQSSELQSYQTLKNEYLAFAQENHIPKRPLHWHGFRILPQEFEFWLDGPHRLHLRHKYKLVNNSWQHKFLYP